MYPNNGDEKWTYPDSTDDSVNEPVYSEPTYSEPVYSEPTYSEPIYTEPTYTEPVYSEPTYTEPVYSEPTYSEPTYSEPVYSEPTYSEPVYSEPTYTEPVYTEPTYTEPAYTEPVYSEPVYTEPTYTTPTYTEPTYSEPTYSTPAYTDPNEQQWNMYSPGICTSQPYPRTYTNDTLRQRAPRGRNRKSGSFLRAVCLILVCSLFSGAATYAVIDYRFKRGDFTINNQVVLGAMSSGQENNIGSSSDNQQEDNLTGPVSTLNTNISAQDIYDMARTQVVGIITQTQSIFGTHGSHDSTSPITGSGFIVSSDGYILTNYHVIELAHRGSLPLSVVLNDGTSYEAKIIGFDIGNDVGVIKIDAVGLNPAIIGDSDNIRVGQTVYAVGNPFGDLVYTMTDGIVSALDRVVSVEGKSISTFQLSAAVNSGNSGGPVYNTSGEVIGIVTAKIVRGNVEGIGFAIPINDAIEIAFDLLELGYISGRPLIGITGETVSSGHAAYYDWVVGTYVMSVAPDSAAEAAGIAVGDIITKLGDVDVDSMDELRYTLRSHRAGDATTITVWRDGEVIDLPIVFDEDMFAGQPQLRRIPQPDIPSPFTDLP